MTRLSSVRPQKLNQHLKVCCKYINGAADAAATPRECEKLNLKVATFQVNENMRRGLEDVRMDESLRKHTRHAESDIINEVIRRNQRRDL